MTDKQLSFLKARLTTNNLHKAKQLKSSDVCKLVGFLMEFNTSLYLVEKPCKNEILQMQEELNANPTKYQIPWVDELVYYETSYEIAGTDEVFHIFKQKWHKGESVIPRVKFIRINNNYENCDQYYVENILFANNLFTKDAIIAKLCKKLEERAI